MNRSVLWARCIRVTGFVYGLVLACFAWPAQLVRAAGVEDTVGGTIALGRAANYVRVNDFMAVWQNPANLALVPGRDAGLELRLPVFNACFDRTRNPDVEYKPQESFNKVCNEKKLFPTGNVGYAQSFGNGLGFGVGIYTPAAIAKLRYGDDTIVTFGPDFPNEQFQTTTTGQESANRYLLLSREVIAAFLMAGIGWQIIPELRIGLSAGFGWVFIDYKNVASLTGRTFVDQEVLTQAHVRDWFVPRGTFSVVGKPLESLELMAQLTATADIVADGHLDARANGIYGAPRGNCRSQDPGTFCRIDDVTLRVPFQRIELYLGARYAHLRPGLRGARLDPMQDEVWDLELDLYFANTGHVDAFRLQLYDVPPADPRAARIDFTSDPSGSPSPLPPNAVIPKEWNNTYGVRLGGDYNVLRGRLSLRAGLSYESRAAPLSYMNIDYFPVNKVGLHFGATVAIGMARISIAYAHLFYEQRTVPVGTGRVPEIVALDRAQAQAVNEGSYSARADILSLQANLRF